MFKKYTIIFITIAILASFIAGIFVGEKNVVFSELNTEKNLVNREIGQPENVDFSLFWDVWKTVEEKHVNRSISSQEMVYGAINGMISSLGDPYSLFMDPEETKQFSEDISGSFEGVGMEIGIKDKILTVIAPLKNTPAYRAGIKAGDKILEVDEISTFDISIDDAVRLIRGQKGTEVKLTILRESLEDTIEISVVRDTIEIKSVEWEIVDSDKTEKKIAHLKIYHFNEDTTQKLEKAIDEILAEGIYGIVLDLRNNPGGYLETSVEIANCFIKKGSVVAIEDFSNGKKEYYRAKKSPRLEKFPLVILINEGSASASEILAGALRDIREIKLIGKKTFGKGSVQELKRLKDGSSVRITVARWLTPNGVCINEEGLAPDIEVEMTDEDFNEERDPQLDEAVKMLK
jgi:carboxyl-terminal processing protease